MASQIMEIVIFDVQPMFTNETHPLLTNSKWNDVLSALPQQDGVRTVCWGQTIESQDKVYLLIGTFFSLQFNESNHDSNG